MRLPCQNGGTGVQCRVRHKRNNTYATTRRGIDASFDDERDQAIGNALSTEAQCVEVSMHAHVQTYVQTHA
ncbi:hypothetical protein Rwratislav_37107 [Rhodococcus wratislaviensis IFP 2016]|nr:hypothetical protein Rwratislav_37107 [Rhodococcus wratislaviensis IFP 2016]